MANQRLMMRRVSFVERPKRARLEVKEGRQRQRREGVVGRRAPRTSFSAHDGLSLASPDRVFRSRGRRPPTLASRVNMVLGG